ncbi:S9 family peptidase [Hymenobacter cellulosilyticus]|uniref:Prolyl oligopeptidase family serine peptidase n=1 Tax=Hymenobacter cellulosilyticus TaxID=2932248 RepID=A0A8T9Q648_9BACT|nr:prolyl oligopeptidase family serine peptidase [Hymenobacter cellulosilyticus]UOQ72585.1 prolyl oligopeptidase family serine peptidase [Hymenobacter cellulosilyticus]
MRSCTLLSVLAWLPATALAQAPPAAPLTSLTVEKIMRDPAQWIGSSPSNVGWSEDGKRIYFSWNPEKARRDSLYSTSASGGAVRKVSLAEQRALPTTNGDYDQKYTRKVYEKDGDIFLLELKTAKTRRVTRTTERETDPGFALQGKLISYTRGGNLFTWDPATGETVQRTDFRRGSRPGNGQPTDKAEKFLRAQQLALFDVIKQRDQDQKARQRQQKATARLNPKAIWLGQQTVQNLQLSPDGRFVTYRLAQEPAAEKVAVVPSFVTASGFTEDIPTRTKVGAPQATAELGIYDIGRDTTFVLGYKELKGLDEQPAYRKEYALPAKAPVADADKAGAPKKDKPAELRRVEPYGPYWSENGQHAFLVIRSSDNKDRWVVSLDPATQKISLLDRQRDEAWINGPGIGYGPGNVGWLPDNKRVWFQSEESGYSHLYTVDVTNGQKKALTSGNFEVQKAQLSRDKKLWYLTANKTHPGEQHFYRMPVDGGTMTQITSMPGASEVTLSPDEKTLAVRYSYTNKPWELYVMDNKPGAKARQITNSLTEEFKSYPWRDPEVITIKARDGADVYARLYRPAKAEAQGPAVIFVHGAGYLQNAHKWWSQYSREYMFHNLLVDKGYTVLDIDYRGSAGYGRDVRTGIYRYMGGKDLTDQVDGAKLLAEKYGVSPQRIGIYGGSYGGFITLMAMFTQPDVFKAGAALRSVTDWAHYNHGYTDNILNSPYNDSIAYARSSPIYYADGLKGALLMCHGMVDTNVHFQDIVRLSQRLIELKKENWELAVYPVEDHGFVEPASWTDEYKRILKLFETNLRPGATGSGSSGN